jgi:hypothetical protein
MKTDRQTSMLDPCEDHMELHTQSRFDVLIPRLGIIGRQAAIRVGVHPNDLDDCEITFVERMILLNDAKLKSTVNDGSFVWINVCARHHALNFLRDVSRYGRKVVSLEISTRRNFRDVLQQNDPQSSIIRSSLFDEISDCFEDLKPEVKEMLIRHVLLDEPVAVVADSLGRSRNATDQAMFRAKKNIREHLERKGLDMSDFGGTF